MPAPSAARVLIEARSRTSARNFCAGVSSLSSSASVTCVGGTRNRISTSCSSYCAPAAVSSMLNCSVTSCLFSCTFTTSLSGTSNASLPSTSNAIERPSKTGAPQFQPLVASFAFCSPTG